MSKKSLRTRRESGNVLFIIMIAIALLAALTFFVTSTDRGNPNVSPEQAIIKANQILAFAHNVEGTVERMLLEGVPESQLCFFTGNNNATYNYAACATPRNVVFSTSGTNYDDPPRGANDGSEWYFTGQVRIEGLGSSAGELSIMLAGIDISVCSAINNVLGRNFTSSPPTGLNTFDTAARFTGTYSAAEILNGDAEINGISALCFKESTTGNYFFYYALLPR